MPELSSITPDLAGLRALAHPTRVRILGQLRVEGPATATTLAERFGLNTGQTSYHLRQLEKHGFVVEDTERGNGRDRWWRAAHESTHTDGGAIDAQDRDTLDAYLRSVAVVYAQTLQAAVDERPLLPEAWRRASTFSDYGWRLAPDRAREVIDRIHALLAEYDDQEDPAAVAYTVQYQAFPRPGHVPPAAGSGG